MAFALHILARGDDGAGKIIAAIIFLTIWGISALINWINKQQQEAKRRAAMSRPTPPPLPSPRRVPQGLAESRQQPIARGAIRRPVRRIPVPPMAPAPRLAQPVAKILAPAATPKPPPHPTSANAPAIAHWLKPATLRYQFVLTEILQPPLALRAAREL